MMPVMIYSPPTPQLENAVATRNYRPLQMHRIPYTDLTDSQAAAAACVTG